jgi:predicted permease
MPALLFEAIATSDLGLLQARVILAMLLSKLIVMALAVVVGMRYDDKSPRRASTGGVFGMFVVNSLDLALGIPLMKALYPQYIVTLYFFEIVTSLVLVPVCMGFCEYGNESARLSVVAATAAGSSSARLSGGGGGGHGHTQKVIRTVIRNLATDPLVLSGALGTAWNLALGSDSLPATVRGTLTILGGAFSCGALLLIGMSSVGQLGAAMKGKAVVLPLLLTLGKSVVLPILMREAVVLLRDPDGPEPPELEEFCFLYGALPTGTSTIVIAFQYDAGPPARVASSMVINLITSAPLMFISSVLLNSDSPATLFRVTHSLALWCSAASAVGATLVLLGFALHAPWNTYPMLFVRDLAAVQLIDAVFHFSCEHQEGMGGFGSSAYYTGGLVAQLWARAATLSLGYVLARLVLDAKRRGANIAQAVEQEVAAASAQRSLRRVHRCCVCASAIYALGFGLGFAAFGQAEADAGLSCWMRYGTAQYAADCVAMLVCFGALGYFFLVYQKNPSSSGGSGGAAAAAALGGAAAVAGGDGDAAAEALDAGLLMEVNPGVTEEAGDGGSPEKADPAPAPALASKAAMGFKFRTSILIVQELFRLFLQIFAASSFLHLSDESGTHSRVNRELIFSGGALVQMLFLLVIFLDGGGFLTFWAFGLQASVQTEFRTRWAALVTRYWRQGCFGVEVDMLAAGSAANQSVLAQLAAAMRGDASLVRRRAGGGDAPGAGVGCMSGMECVNWLLAHDKAASRDEATRVCDQLLYHGLLHHEAHASNFQDEPTLMFQFASSGDDVEMQPRQAAE